MCVACRVRFAFSPRIESPVFVHFIRVTGRSWPFSLPIQRMVVCKSKERLAVPCCCQLFVYTIACSIARVCSPTTLTEFIARISLAILAVCVCALRNISEEFSNRIKMASATMISINIDSFIEFGTTPWNILLLSTFSLLLLPHTLKTNISNCSFNDVPRAFCILHQSAVLARCQVKI